MNEFVEEKGLEEESVDPKIRHLQRYSNKKKWRHWRVENERIKAFDCPSCGFHEMDCAVVIGVGYGIVCPNCGRTSGNPSLMGRLPTVPKPKVPKINLTTFLGDG